MISRSSIALSSIGSLKEELFKNDAQHESKRITKVGLDQEESLKESNLEQQLEAKMLRLRQFIDDLGQLRDTPINLDLFDQLEVDQDVYKRIGYETVIHEAQKRIEKMTKTRKLKRNWSVCDLKILIWLICKHCEKDAANVSNIHNQYQSWELISSLIPGTTAQSCLFKWLSLKRHKITLYGWSEKQKEILIQLQKKHTQSRNKWKYISEQLYSLNTNLDKIYRHPKQCREHYSSFLDPQIKSGPWTQHQDLTLLSHIIQNKGQKKWCKLVKIIKGRTQNAIKNRFQLIFSKLKRKKQNKNKTELQLVNEYFRDNGGESVAQKKQKNIRKETKIDQDREQEPIQQLPSIKSIPNLVQNPSMNFLSFRSLVSRSAFIPYNSVSDCEIKMINKSFNSIDLLPSQDQK